MKIKSYIQNKIKKAHILIAGAWGVVFVSLGFYFKKCFEVVNMTNSNEQTHTLWILVVGTIIGLIVACKLVDKTNKLIAGEDPIEKFAPYHQELFQFTQILKDIHYFDATTEHMFQMACLAKEYNELNETDRYFINNKDRIEKRFFELHKLVYEVLIFNPPNFKSLPQHKAINEKQAEDLMNSFFFTLGDIDKKDIEVFQAKEKDIKEVKTLNSSM